MLDPEGFGGGNTNVQPLKTSTELFSSFTSFKNVSPGAASHKAVLRSVLNRQGTRISLILRICPKKKHCFFESGTKLGTCTLELMLEIGMHVVAVFVLEPGFGLR